MTTTSAEGKRIDQNGEVAALIKVVTPETGFVFEGGTLGIVGTQQRVSEIWVWVPRASRKITILHQQLGQLRDYRFPVEIEADRTYEMVLTTAKVETIVKEEVAPECHTCGGRKILGRGSRRQCTGVCQLWHLYLAR